MDLALPIRTPTELDSMRAAGRVVAATLAAVRAAAAPGVRLRDLDELARTCIAEAGATPSFLGYRPTWAPRAYDGVLCLSPNETVVHGRPSGRRLADGDLLSIDCGAIVDGWHGDGAVTVHIGAADGGRRAVAGGDRGGARGRDRRRRAGRDPARRRRGDRRGRPPARLPARARPRRARHRPADARGPVHRERADRGGGLVPLRPGNTVALEPMLVIGAGRYKHKRDGWAVVTVDGSRAAHAEHTVLVTESGGQPLTVL